MTNVSCDCPNFSGLAWIFKLLLSKHTETSIWCHWVIKTEMDLVKTMLIKIPLMN
jgi:hypothetical protein